jgi:hypothetical protein
MDRVCTLGVILAADILVGIAVLAMRACGFGS